MRSTTILLATAALALATTAPVAAKQKATPCSGRFVLDQGKMALGTTESAPVVDAVTLDAGGVMISQACGFKQAKQAATRKGWKVRARWKQCGDAKQIDLRASLDKACTTLDGRIDVRKPKIKKRKFGAATCGENGSNSSAAPKSTWDSIQTRVFAPHGCTDQLCHGSAAGAAQSGGLDLRPEVAYENLIDVPASTGTLKRIFPGDQLKSQLWLKVAKATLGTSDDVGTGMPVGLPPLTPDELEALKVWIRGGAPKTGVVPHTAELLGACLPKNTPNKMRPAAPPAAGDGVQFYAPPWPVEAHGENEICYPTYYDFSNDPNVPKFPCDPANPSGDQCFAYRGTELTQSPNSHHSIIHSYGGPNGPDDPAWGAWTCLGGDKAGQACDPRQPNATECPGGGCAGTVKKSFACIGYGPSDFAGSGLGSGIGGSQQPYEEIAFPDGVYSVLPAKGIIVWNSHAFNLTDELETTEQWFNVYFAPERQTPMLQVFDAADIFIMNVPPFEKREYCRTLEPFPFVGIEFPQNSCLFRLSSHNHKRGVLFRTWGPGITDRCTSRCQGTYAPNQVPRGCSTLLPQRRLQSVRSRSPASPSCARPTTAIPTSGYSIRRSA